MGIEFARTKDSRSLPKAKRSRASESDGRRVEHQGHNGTPLFLQRSSDSSPSPDTQSAGHAVAKAQSQPGRSLGAARLHVDTPAADAANLLGARAFTVGTDVFFGRGEYSPRTLEGDRMLRHEMAHVEQASGPVDVDSEMGIDVASDEHPAEREARAAEQGTISRAVPLYLGQATVFRHRVAPTPVARRTAVNVFGDGTAANPGLTLSEFEAYTRVQADWFAEPSLTAADRSDLWSLLLRTADGAHVLAGVGDVKVADLRSLVASDWTALDAFCRACHAGSSTVRIAAASAYALPDRIVLVRRSSVWSL